MELPADHPLRDVAAVREALLQQLTDAIRLKLGGRLGLLARQSVQRAGFALSAIAGLIKHQLVPAGSPREPLRRGDASAWRRPGLEPDHPFRLDAFPYVKARSEEAAEAGNQAEAERWGAVGRDLLTGLEADSTFKQRLLRLLLSGSGGDEVGSTEILQELVAGTVPEATSSGRDGRARSSAG